MTDPITTTSPRQIRKPTARVHKVRSAGRAAVGALRLRRSLTDVRGFCFFLGYARSGTTLVAATLNAHPEIVVANELDVLHCIERGMGRNQIFSQLLQRDRDFAATDYHWTGYNYAVPGQFQGRFERLRVLGDKRAGQSTHRLGEHPELLDRLRDTLRLPIRVIHVVRNPYDTITTMAWRGDGELAPVIEKYRWMSTTVDEIRARLQPDELLDVRYESFVEHPERHLSELCTFLGVGSTTAYLQACALLVNSSSSRSRDRLPWSSVERREIEDLIERRPILAGYEFDA